MDEPAISRIVRLRQAFNAVDPVGIYITDDNLDEYDMEIKMLLDSHVNLKNVGAVNIELDRIFRRCFEGISIKEDRLRELALRIQQMEM